MFFNNERITTDTGYPLAETIKHPNGDQTLRDTNGQIIGQYNAVLNVTKDRHNQTLTYGNSLTSLVPGVPKKSFW